MAYEATLLYHPLTVDQLTLLKTHPNKFARCFELMGVEVFLTGRMDGRWNMQHSAQETYRQLKKAEKRYGRPMAAILWQVPVRDPWETRASFFDMRRMAGYLGGHADENLYGDWQSLL